MIKKFYFSVRSDWLLFFLLVFLLPVFLHFPLCYRNLKGEEGLLGLTAFCEWQAPNAFIGGKVGNKFMTFAPEHPIAPYYYLRGLGRAIQFIARCCGHELAPRDMVFQLRWVLSLMNTLAVFFLCLVLARHKVVQENRTAFTAVAAALVTSYYFSCQSVYIQYEGMFGLAAFCLFLGVLVWTAVSQNKASTIFLLIASAIVGLGKNEGSMLFLVALTVAGIWQFIAGKRPFFFTALLGLLIGNACSYLLDPYNYLAGFGVMKRILNQTSAMALAERAVYAGRILKVFFLPLSLIGFLAILTRSCLLLKKGVDTILWFALLCSIGIYLAYICAFWAPDAPYPRYYVVIFPFLLLICGVLLGRRFGNLRRRILLFVSLASLAGNAGKHVWHYFKDDLTPAGQMSRGSYAIAMRELECKKGECLFYAGHDVVFYLQKHDFASSDLGDFYKKFTGLKPCPKIKE